MSSSKIPKTKPTSKFGKETRQFSVRLPITTIDKIKAEKIDSGQILYDVIECGKDPYKEETTNLDIGPVITKKLIQLMIDNSIMAPEGFFTETELKVVMNIAKEVMG